MHNRSCLIINLAQESCRKAQNQGGKLKYGCVPLPESSEGQNA